MHDKADSSACIRGIAVGVKPWASHTTEAARLSHARARGEEDQTRDRQARRKADWKAAHTGNIPAEKRPDLTQKGPLFEHKSERKGKFAVTRRAREEKNQPNSGGQSEVYV